MAFRYVERPFLDKKSRSLFIVFDHTILSVSVHYQTLCHLIVMNMDVCEYSGIGLPDPLLNELVPAVFRSNRWPTSYANDL
jgi:hypothetical protein